MDAMNADTALDVPGAQIEAAAVAPAPLATLELTGADVLRYLHTVTSQHTEALTPGDATAALLLSPKGKIEFAFRLAVRPGPDGTFSSVVLDTEAEAAEGLAERLRRFVFRFDVTVADPVPGGVTVLGPGAAAAVSAAGLPVPGADDRAGFAPGLVVRRTPLGIDVVGPGAAVPGPAASSGDLEAARVAAGVPRWGLELTDDVIAEEAGLLGSHVHLAKGCYPGQETVARVHNLGQVQRRLAGLVAEGGAPPPPRTDLVTADGRRAGQVRSGVVHPVLGPIALAYVRRTVATGDRVLAGDQAATVVDLPFRAV
jgi:folate-binding protein YgfZ